jgi:hypothetical protein
MWVEENFPEYLNDGRRIFLTRGKGRITQRTRTRETAPWEFAPNVADGECINMRGYIVTRQPSKKPPYYEDHHFKVSDKTFQKYCDTLNFFRNGGKAMSGVDGLDPRELIGAVRGWKDTKFQCRNGFYIPGTFAEFQFFNGDKWEHRPDGTPW